MGPYLHIFPYNIKKSLDDPEEYPLTFYDAKDPTLRSHPRHLGIILSYQELKEYELWSFWLIPFIMFSMLIQLSLQHCSEYLRGLKKIC